jgi:hypothetical protein
VATTRQRATRCVSLILGLGLLAAALSWLALQQRKSSVQGLLELLRPVPGELTILHLDLPVGLSARRGESTLVIGPDGTLLLIDVGSSKHHPEVRGLVRELNTRFLTAEHGFAPRAPLQVEWVLLTHYHADHIGAFRPLFLAEEDPLDVVHGIVHRGFVDLGGAVNANHFQALCEGLRQSLAPVDRPLCVADRSAPCQAAAWSDPAPARACPGLQGGSLLKRTPGAEAEAAFIPLGGGARLVLTAVNGWVSAGAQSVAAAPFGHEHSNEENARSIAGLLEHGAFRYHFGGDLSGSGRSGVPDVETQLALVAAPKFLGSLGVDVVHAHHHGRRTSSNPRLVDALAPADGRSRNVIAGAGAAYLGSPHAEVVERWSRDGRLGLGRFWVTRRAAGGAAPRDFPALIDARASVLVRTLDGGDRYLVQADGRGAAAVFFSLRRADGTAAPRRRAAAAET